MRNKPAQTIERVTSAIIRRKNDLKRAARGTFSFESRSALVEKMFENKGLGSIGADSMPLPDSVKTWACIGAPVDGSKEPHRWAIDIEGGKVTHLGTLSEPRENAYTADLKLLSLRAAA